MTTADQVFIECVRARAQGELIQRVSASDKEFHFQNWVRDRIEASGLDMDDPGRNTYPDFRLVQQPEGFEVKGLAWPGRVADYDSNSQVPSGSHHGREIYYVFGRYPKEVSGMSAYPVVDLVICHGSFLNADSSYVHKNDSFRGFGSYGDILVRDRKMYVVPTPYALLDGTAGVATLIVPQGEGVDTDSLTQVGEITRTEVNNIVTSYEFNLETNEMVTHLSPNPSAGREHHFSAYRVTGHGDNGGVSLSAKALAYAESLK